MKPKIFTAILLFISAYSPLALILAIKDFDFEVSMNFRNPIAIYILLLLSLLSILILFYSINATKRGNMPVKIIEVENRSVDLINYTIPYIVSFFGFDLTKIDDVISLSIFMLLMLLLTIKSKSVFLNPILLIAGYNLYDLKYEFNKSQTSKIILSKHELKKGDLYYIRSLTRFLYLAKEKTNHNDD